MPAKFADDTVDVSGLGKMQKLLKQKLPVARVGILSGTARSDGPTNADVGAAHEFGTSRLPQRSFLRMPLELKLNEFLGKTTAFNDDVLKSVMRSGSLKLWVQKIATVAKNVVLGAFDTAGYGRWAAWKPGYENNTGNVLVNTQQLRNSITEDVVE
jgi:phage gpG-like protein